MPQAWRKAKRVVGGTSNIESKALCSEEYPELTSFLGGIASPEGKGMDLNPHSLTLWIDGDMLHWVLQSQHEINKLYGSVRSIADGLALIEEALKNEAFSPRKRK